MPRKKLTLEERRARKNAAAAAEAAEAARISAMIKELPPIYKCVKCGKIVTDPVGSFYLIGNNGIYDGNDGRVHICSVCASQMFENYQKEYEDRKDCRKVALMLTCMQIGCYFSEDLYDKMEQAEYEDPQKNEFTLGKYVRCLNGKQYKKQNFAAYMLELLKSKSGFKDTNESREEIEAKWKKGDRLNKAQCLRAVGYDPFEDDNYSCEDRRQLFNGLSRYLMMGDIAEDKHKMDAAIQIVTTNHQLTWIDHETNRELRSPSPDFGRLDKLSGTKSALSRVVNQLAKENGISMSGAGKKSQSGLALTSIMKDMIDANVMEVKTNLTSVKMTETFQNIANINAKALMDELNFTGDEYAEMVTKQGQTIKDLNDELLQVKEDLRLMTIRAHEAEKPMNKRTITHKIDISPDILEEDEKQDEEETDMDVM